VLCWYRVAGNVRWQLGRRGADAGQQVDVETTFLLQICDVVERIIDDERRLLQLIHSEMVPAGVANYYINVVVANAGLRVHAGVHRLLERPSPDCTGRPPYHCSAVLDQLGSEPTTDLRLLADVRRQVLQAQLEQLVTGMDDWRTSAVTCQLDSGDWVTTIISDEVDRVINSHSDAARQNMDHCNVLTLATLGARLQRQDHAHWAAIMDRLAEQLWTSAADAASHVLTRRLTTMDMTSHATDQLTRWISFLSQATLSKVSATHLRPATVSIQQTPSSQLTYVSTALHKTHNQHSCIVSTKEC